MRWGFHYVQVKFNISLIYLFYWFSVFYAFSFMMFKTVNLLEKLKPFCV